MGLVPLLLDRDEIRPGHFCHYRLADTPFGVMAVAAKRASGSAAETLSSADLGPVKTELVRAPI